MGFWRKLLGLEAWDYAATHAPRASVPDGGVIISTPAQLEAAILGLNETGAGVSVNATTAMRCAAVNACVGLISGAVGNMPVKVLRRIDDRTRASASDHSLWAVFNRRPNRWQKPAQFKRMMTAHVLLRGNAYAFIGRDSRGNVTSLVPLHPDRMRVEQLSDQYLVFHWTKASGEQVVFGHDEVLHLTGPLSSDGITGVGVIAAAREAIGLALAQERHGTTMFANGANVSGALKFPTGKRLDAEKVSALRAQMDEFRDGRSRAGGVVVLEDGLEWQQIALTPEDAQWVESRKFSRGEVAMFFRVPPHMIGDTDKSTSWGTGLDTQGQNFVTYTLEDYLTMWEEALMADCLDGQRDADIFVRFNRAALVRGDLKTRWEGHVKALQWGVASPNEVRVLEDMNPRDGGDVFYPPPNMTADSSGANGNVDT